MDNAERDEKLIRHDERIRVVERIVYGLVGLVGVAVVAAIMRLILN